MQLQGIILTLSDACLVEAGAEMECADQFGRTALMIAAEAAYLGVTRLLLEAGASKDCKDRKGRTALLLASKCGSRRLHSCWWKLAPARIAKMIPA